MGFLGVALVFLGYQLTYASVANHGRFASTPWAALFADAYSDGSGSGGTSAKPPHSAPSGASASPPPIQAQSA